MRGAGADDARVYDQTLKAAGLDRQPCAVHMQYPVGWHLWGIDEEALTHLDRVLLPILQRLARERPPEVEPVLLALWEREVQDCVRLEPEVRKLLWHHVAFGNDLVRSQCHPPSPTASRAGLDASNPGLGSRGD